MFGFKKLYDLQIKSTFASMRSILVTLWPNIYAIYDDTWDKDLYATIIAKYSDLITYFMQNDPVFVHDKLDRLIECLTIIKNNMYSKDRIKGVEDVIHVLAQYELIAQSMAGNK